MAASSVNEIAAEWYAKKGYRVFPLHSMKDARCTCRQSDCGAPAKHPRIARWPEYATTDEEMIRTWWRLWPDANVGLMTGEASGIVVLDVDPRHGGEEALRELSLELGELPKTTTAITGSGGRHLVFRHPGCHVPNSAGKLGPGLDVRGDGGYIVAPPSLHASGQRYVWDKACNPLRTEPAPMPKQILDLIVADEERCHCFGDSLPALVLENVMEGKRNTTLARLAGVLLSHGISVDTGIVLLKSWNKANCHPPMTEAEVLRTMDSIAGTALRRRR